MTPSTAYSRDLGDELRRLRETCTGLKSNELAKKLGWDPSKISTIEHGKARASEIDLIQFLSMCGKDIDYVVEFKRRYHYAFDDYIVQPPSMSTNDKATSVPHRMSERQKFKRSNGSTAVAQVSANTPLRPYGGGLLPLQRRGVAAVL